MRFMRWGIWLVVATLAASGGAHAQSTTGTISGRVVDTQERSVPGVTVSVESANLQGVRTAVTSENGDYIFTLLPSGQYTITFELSGFERQQRTVALAPTQVVPIDVTLGLAGVAETVEVVGRSADVMTQTAQVATNYSSQLIASLPTNRDINTALVLAPSDHATGPSGNFSIAGSMSFESLYLVNGVTVNENLRGQASVNLVIEDAIQETTVASAGISAEYGRFGGGVVNVVTRSGGNQFSGSFRDSLNSDRWRKLTPSRPGDTFAADTNKVRNSAGELVDAPIVPTYEYTFGGPVMRDRLWFFTAGRLQKQESARQLVVTNIPYTFTNDTKRYEFKGTYSATSNHRFQASYNNLLSQQLNNTFNTSQSMDMNSLENRKVPEDLFTVNYSGVLTPSFFVEARFSQRQLTFDGSGSQFSDRIYGTLLVDPAGRRYWSPTFCAVCTQGEQRDNQNTFVKGSYFLSTSGSGSHNLTFGYDNFSDVRKANNYQSGSSFRVLNANAVVRNGTELFPQFTSASTTVIQWNPIFIESQGSDFRTHALFVNDAWRADNNLTLNLGIRFDKNHGVDQAGKLVSKNDAFSPRFGAIWDPLGDQRWSITGSVAKYTAGLLNSLADATSPAGNSDQYRFAYTGPAINGDPNGPLLTSDQALAQLFAWFDANGGANLPLYDTPSVRGVSPQILDSLAPPANWEYAGGATRQFASRAAVRADFVYRKFQDFYMSRTDTTTGRATDTRSFAPASVQGRVYDLTVIENETEGRLRREYTGLTVQSNYRFGASDFGGNYTLSRTWGNVDGETPNNGPVNDGSAQYPEYKQADWNFPVGDLNTDQRHRARLWINYAIPRVDGLMVSALQTLESGVPYSASNQNSASFNGVNPRLYVTNPGYINPPTAAQTQYYFTARDAFRTEGQKRTDLAVNYNRGVAVGGKSLDAFVQLQVVNLFNQFQLCGCGASVFLNGGNVQNQFVDTSVRTNVTNATVYQPFNPFTETPVEGVHWDKGPAFGKAVNRFAYTSPRMMRVSFGVRF